MSFSTTAYTVQYNGNGSTTAFAVPFLFYENSHLKVTLTSSAGIDTVQTITTHYTVAGAGVSSGGTVTMLTAPASGSKLTIERIVPLVQQTELDNDEDFPSENVEKQLDLTVQMIQQISATGGSVDRSLKYPSTEPSGFVSTLPVKASRAGKIISFDANGNLLVTSELGTWKGNWTTATAYVLRDLVLDAVTNNVYICTEAHTSGTLATDVSASKWALVVNAEYVKTQADSATASASTATTQAGIATTQAGIATTKAGEALTSANNASTSASNALTSENNASASEANAAQSALDAASYPIPLWVTATSYLVGKTVIESNKIYRCIVAHTSGTFAADLSNGNWVEISATASVPSASETTAGIAELATQTETNNGTDDTRIVTPLKLVTHLLAQKASTIDAGTTSGGLVLRNNAGTPLLSLGVGSSSSTNSTFAGAVNFTGTPTVGSNPIVGVETGTWTPTLTFVTAGDLSVTYTTQNGYYYRLGKMCLIYGQVVPATFTHTTASGALKMSLPFVSANKTNGVQAICTLGYQGIVRNTNTVHAFVDNNASTVGFKLCSTDGTSSGDVNTTTVPTTYLPSFIIGGVYETA